MATSEETMWIGMQERLVRVETKLDGLSETLRTRHTEDDIQRRADETRIRTLETDVAQIKVRVALVSSAVGTAAGVVSTLLMRLVGG